MFNSPAQIELTSAIIRNPIIVSTETKVSEAIAQMSGVQSQCDAAKTIDNQSAQLVIEVRASCVLVVDNEQLVGIVTERDVVRLSAEQLPLDVTVTEVMARPVVTLRESAFTDLFLAINLIQQHHIRHLPIVDDSDRLVGLVTYESLRQTSRPIDLLRLRLVKEVMTREVICAAPEESMLAIAKLMAHYRISSVIIAETRLKQDNCLQVPVGILAERDIVQFQALGLNLESWTAAAMMSTPIFAVKPEDSLWMVHQIMEQHFISRIAVVGEEGAILGIITQTSLLQLNPIEIYNLAEVLEQKVIRLEAEKISLLEGRNELLENQQVITYQQLQEELIERKKVEAELIELNQSLEIKVQERTKALHSSESHVRAIIEAIPDLLLRVSRDGKCLEYINSKYPEQNFLPIQNHLSEVLPPDLLQQQLEMLEKSIATGELQVYEHQIYRGDRFVFEEVRIVPISDDEVLIIVRDQTERKQAELALQKSETRFRRIYESDIVGMMFTDLNGQISDANDRFLEMLGYTREDLNAKQISWENITPPEYLPIDRHAIQHLKLSLVIEPWEKVYYHKDGHSVHVLVGLALLSEDECIFVVVDISDRKQAEELIRQQVDQEKLLAAITQRIRLTLNLPEILQATVQQVHQVLKSDRVLVYRVFPDGTGSAIAESVLPQWSPILDITFPKEIFPQVNYDRYIKGRIYALSDREAQSNEMLPCLVEFLTERQVRAKLVVPIIQNNSLWGLLIVHQCDRPRHWQTWEINLLQQIANQLAIAIQQADLFEKLQQELRDRHKTQQHLTEINQKLAMSNEELARATRLKDEFLANMSHELRTPLNAILGMTEGMQEQIFGKVTDSQIKALQTIERSGLHLLELINDILDIAKIESGQIDLEYSNVPVEFLCQYCLPFVKQQALKKSIQLETRIAPNLLELNVDERRIRQVLINLLNNAVKFTPDGGFITLEVSGNHPPSLGNQASSNQPSAIISTKPELAESSYLYFSVIDTGIGISPANITKLFQPFIQIDSALNRQYQGTGLGLALVKRIVEMHGGIVMLTSEIGVGSCFTIALPYKASTKVLPSVINQTEAASECNQNTQSRSYTILLVEDNELNTMTISSYLTAKGYKIVVAQNGQEALALVQVSKPDLILMDIQMPVMDGIEATKQIRKIPSLDHVPIIAITALAMDKDVEHCLAAGANDYLSKPVKLRQLTQLIQKILVSN
ncbi:MAG: CBS domain-containing protein [Pseudanabaena sp.]